MRKKFLISFLALFVTSAEAKEIFGDECTKFTSYDESVIRPQGGGVPQGYTKTYQAFIDVDGKGYSECTKTVYKPTGNPGWNCNGRNFSYLFKEYSDSNGDRWKNFVRGSGGSSKKCIITEDKVKFIWTQVGQHFFYHDKSIGFKSKMVDTTTYPLRKFSF